MVSQCSLKALNPDRNRAPQPINVIYPILDEILAV